MICYYEPFHEVLSEPSLGEQIKNHKPLEAGLALRHPVQGQHYFYEYKELLEQNRLNFSPELSYQNYFLSEDQPDASRYTFIQTLISHAADANRTPALCFCRSQIRSAWIKKNFGGSHVGQVRDASAQYESFGVLPYFRNTMITIALDLWRNHPGCFTHIPNFERFAAAFEKRKSLPAEQLYEYFLKPDDFVAIFLLIWLLSTLQSIGHSDLVLDIDRLSTDRSYQAFVQEWFAGLGCIIDLSDCVIPKADGADRDKSDSMTVEAGRAMRRTFCDIAVYDSQKVSAALTQMSDRSRRTVELFLDQ